MKASFVLIDRGATLPLMPCLKSLASGDGVSARDFDRAHLKDPRSGKHGHCRTLCACLQQSTVQVSCKGGCERRLNVFDYLSCCHRS